MPRRELGDIEDDMQGMIKELMNRPPAAPKGIPLKPKAPKPSGIPQKSKAPTRWAKEEKQVLTALNKLGVQVEIVYEHKPIHLDPTIEADRDFLINKQGISPEEVQDAIENGLAFETQGSHFLYDSEGGQKRARIEILPDADEGTLLHEAGHAIEEQGLIPGWVGTKEQHAKYLADVLGVGEEQTILKDGVRGPPLSPEEQFSTRKVQKESAPIQSINKKKAPLKLFHSVKLPDLEMIQGVGNKIISPSFGIARDEKIPGRYGDITFIVPTKMLKNTPIWNRDIWSPTVREAPEVLYFIDRNSKEARLLQKYGPDQYRYLEGSLTYRDNAPEQFASIELQSDGDLYNSAELIAEELGMQFDYEDEDMTFKVLNRLANGLIKQCSRTPENIARWLKENASEKGSGSFFKGGQMSARKIPYDELTKEAQTSLLDNADEELSKTLFGKQYDAREKVADLLKLKQDSYYSLRPRMDDELAGEWAVMPFEEFAGEMREWKLRDSELKSFNDTILKKAHKMLQKAYRDVPAEYFEAKSYDVFNINQFPNVVSSNPEGIQKLQEMGYTGQVHQSFTDYIEKAEQKELLYSVRRVPAKKGIPQKQEEKLVPPPTEKEVMGQYEKIKDIWIGEKDVRILQAQNEMYMNQMMIKEALGIKKYTAQAKDYDRAIQIYLDLKRNPDHLEKYYDDLTKEQQRIVDLSQNLPPKIQEVANRIDQSYKELALQAQNVEVINNVLENYVARVWKMTPEGIPGAMRKFSKTTGHAKQRKIETILQGQALGYDLQIEGATNSLLQYREELVKVVEDKIFLEMLKKMKTSEGLPVVTTDPPHGVDYVRLEHPNLNTWKWVGKVEPGKTFGRNTLMTKTGDILERRELYAPKKIAKNLNNILGISKLKGKPGIHEITKYNAILKSWILQSSLFHHTAYMRSYYLGTNGKQFFEMSPRNAYRLGLEAIHQENPVVMLGVRNGLTLGLRQDWNEQLVREGTALGKLIDKVPGAGPLKHKIQELRQLQADFLFESLGAGLKAKSFMLEYNNQVKKHPNQDPKVIANRVANLINDDFGGLHLQRMGRDPTIQHIFRIFCLAADWTESNIRSMVKMFNKDKDTRHTYQRFWAGIVTKGLIATAIANVIMATLDDDDDPETNAVKRYLRNLDTAWKQGKLRYLDVDITPIYRGLGGKSKERKYFSIVGHFKDPIKFILNPFRSAKHKTSVIGGMVLDAASGTDWAGRRFTDAGDLIKNGEAVKWSHKGSGPVKWQQIPSFFMAQSRGSMPVQFQNLMSWYFGEMEAFDAIANGAGLGVATTYNLGETK